MKIYRCLDRLFDCLYCLPSQMCKCTRVFIGWAQAELLTDRAAAWRTDGRKDQGKKVLYSSVDEYAGKRAGKVLLVFTIDTLKEVSMCTLHVIWITLSSPQPRDVRLITMQILGAMQLPRSYVTTSLAIAKQINRPQCIIPEENVQ